MPSKRLILSFLLALNVILFAALLFSGVSLPRAFGQLKGKAGEFACVTAKTAGQTYEVLYVLDLPNRKLHAFFPKTVQTKSLAYVQPRDLQKDFERTP